MARETASARPRQRGRVAAPFKDGDFITDGSRLLEVGGVAKKGYLSVVDSVTTIPALLPFEESGNWARVEADTSFDIDEWMGGDGE